MALGAKRKADAGTERGKEKAVRREEEEDVDVEEEEEEEEEDVEEEEEEEADDDDADADADDDDDIDNLDAAPSAEAAPSSSRPSQASTGGKVVFVLERAGLETAKVGKTYQLLNADDHATFLRRHKKDPSDYRPDIVHQTLLQILDSPLNKAGRVSAVYVHTSKNVLIHVNPSIRIPRTFKRFCGLMVQLLQKLSIRATNGPDKLLKVVKQPVARHLPVNVPRVGFSYSSETLVRFQDYVTAQKSRLDTSGIVYVLGAMAHGMIDMSYTDTHVSISEYPLSAAYCASRITNAMETIWAIV